ncbi:hypothetical protein [Propionibacterium sp.]|uniref:hypothetical protein n=1 Tax=Propionibacterium sp. TaxID=1977903 RepID=UPI0039EC7F52
MTAARPAKVPIPEAPVPGSPEEEFELSGELTTVPDVDKPLEVLFELPVDPLIGCRVGTVTEGRLIDGAEGKLSDGRVGSVGNGRGVSDGRDGVVSDGRDGVGSDGRDGVGSGDRLKLGRDGSVIPAIGGNTGVVSVGSITTDPGVELSSTFTTRPSTPMVTLACCATVMPFCTPSDPSAIEMPAAAAAAASTTRRCNGVRVGNEERS